MTRVHVTSQISLDLNQLIEGVAQLETPELENFLGQISQLLAQRKSAGLPQLEAELIQQINQSLPPETQHRYDELRSKQRNQTLTAQEHQDLLQMVDIAELATAERLKKLLALANLRKISLPELMQQLEIETPMPNV